jgi:pseudouridine kinase
MSKVLVIGKVFVDIKGNSFAPPHKDAKNVGNVTFSNGGTGRNIAQNMAVLGANTTFLTSITNDSAGKGVVQELEDFNVDTSSVHWVDENGMGMWVAVLDDQGDLVASISHQPDVKHLETAINNKLHDMIGHYDSVVIDLDLPLTLISKIIHYSQQADVPIYGVAAHLNEIQENQSILAGLTAFICNREEAEILLGYEIDNKDRALFAAKTLAERGAPLTIITLSEKGCVYCDATKKKTGHVPTRQVKVIDSTGAGDAFFSGTVSQLIKNEPTEKAIEVGMQAAQKVISGLDSALTYDAVKSISLNK